MATTYYVWSGATGGTNTGGSWTNAFLTFEQGRAAATASGDIILVHYTHQENLAANTTYTFAANVNVISVNKDSSDAPTVMASANTISGWIGSDTTNRNITLAGAFKVYIYGIAFRTAGGTNSTTLIVANTDGAHFELESCYFWNANTNTDSDLTLGVTDTNSYARFVNTTFRFGNTAQQIILRSGRFDFEGCNINTNGSAPTTLIDDIASTGSGPDAKFLGCDFSHITNTLVGSMGITPRTIVFAQCKFTAGVTPLATQTPANKSSGAVYIFDCAVVISGQPDNTFTAYYDAFGSIVSDDNIYFTTGAAGQSWKVVSNPSNCSFYTPFVAPFVDWYNTNTSTSVTPYFEILRDGATSQTAFKNDEVWGEFFVKVTSNSEQSTEYSDRRALWPTTNANQTNGAGTGSWTGEGAGAWSGKIDTGTAITPAEPGAIRGRIVVGLPDTTVYLDPQIRT